MVGTSNLASWNGHWIDNQLIYLKCNVYDSCSWVIYVNIDAHLIKGSEFLWRNELGWSTWDFQ
jgi:hypothetical protein